MPFFQKANNLNCYNLIGTFEGFLNVLTGMYATSALRHYQLKYELQDDTTLSADKRINPTLSTVSHLRERWMQARLGSNDFSVIGAIQNVKKRMPQHKIACEQNETGIIVVLVTDFMLRVHEEMKSSSEVMFVNTTRHVDQTNCSLTILFCSCPAGGLPLGVIITSTQAKEDYIKGNKRASRLILIK